MILPQSKVNTVDTNMSGATSFSIKASAKAFKILSDGLYSDKVKAVIRELSCNALDSHTAAGCPDKPIIVHIPNILEPWFSVRDEGLGLSNDDVLKLYTTYFESTKADSNDQIGALGLGSKSPFSYTDSFTVVSRFDGMESLYTAYISEIGQPSIQYIMSNETSEPNGVEVKFGVSTHDIREFTSKSALVYRAFKVHPTIIGNEDFKAEERGKELLSGDGWTIYEGSRHQYAVQGNIEYPLNVRNVNNLTDIASFVLSQNIYIDFNIGELDIAASREQLGYDTITMANIVAKAEKIFDEIISQGNSMIESCASKWDAAYMSKKLQNNLYNGDRYLKFEWNDEPIQTSFDWDAVRGDVLKIYRSSAYKLGFKRETSMKYVAPTLNRPTVFLYMDDNYNRNKVKANVKHWLKSNDVYLYIFSDKNIITMSGNPPYLTYSKDIPEAPKPDVTTPTGVYRAKPHELGCNFKKYYKHYYNDESEFTSRYGYITDIAYGKTIIYYVPIINSNVVGDKVTVAYNFAKYTGLLNDHSMLVGIKKSLLEDKKWMQKLHNQPTFKFIEFRQAVKENLQHLLDKPLVKNLLRPIQVVHSVTHDGIQDYKMIAFRDKNLKSLKTHSMFKNITDEIEESNKIIKTLEMEKSVLSYITTNLNEQLSVKEQLLNHYPMLQFVDNLTDYRHTDKIVDYINFVDSVKIKEDCDTITNNKVEERE